MIGGWALVSFFFRPALQCPVPYGLPAAWSRVPRSADARSPRQRTYAARVNGVGRLHQVLALVLLLSACEPEPEVASPPPKLAFVQPSYDFGRVPQGTPVEHQFAFTNDGGTPLTIMNVRSAYDCAATISRGNEIPPHGGAAVYARFDTDAVYGAQRRTITVYSNDPTQQAVMLTLLGEVVLDVAADPSQVYLGVVPPGVPLLREVALRSSEDGVRIYPPQADAPQLALQLSDSPDGAAAAILAIGTAPQAPAGPFSTVIRLPTSSARHPVLRVKVNGIVALDAPTPMPRSTPLPAANGSAAAAPVDTPEER